MDRTSAAARAPEVLRCGLELTGTSRHAGGVPLGDGQAAAARSRLESIQPRAAERLGRLKAYLGRRSQKTDLASIPAHAVGPALDSSAACRRTLGRCAHARTGSDTGRFMSQEVSHRGRHRWISRLPDCPAARGSSRLPLRHYPFPTRRRRGGCAPREHLRDRDLSGTGVDSKKPSVLRTSRWTGGATSTGRNDEAGWMPTQPPAARGNDDPEGDHLAITTRRTYRHTVKDRDHFRKAAPPPGRAARHAFGRAR